MRKQKWQEDVKQVERKRNAAKVWKILLLCVPAFTVLIRMFRFSRVFV